ncbi:reverse transcriptase [Tanacetum coccineum]
MVNSRQLAALIDDSLKNHIADAITATMATVNKTINDQVNKSIDAMNESVKGVCTRQDFLCSEMKKLAGEASTSTALIRSNHPKVSRMAKIEFPKFSGDDPTSWVYRCNQFFKVDAVEDDQKVEVPESQAVSFFLGGLDKDIEMSSLKIVEDIGNYEDVNGEQFSEGVFGYEDSTVENGAGKSSECQEEIDMAAQPQISLNAILGVNTFQTIRVKGQINNHPVNILIDCRSTHNCLDITIAKQIGCPVKESYPLQVLGAGGNYLTSHHVCKGLTWKLQGETFQVDMMLIPLGGCEMVLGVQWLATLEDIVCNFLKLRMEFNYQGRRVALRGAPQTAEFMSTCSDLALTNVHLCLSTLLQEYEEVFTVLKSIPPHRIHDHRIPLLDNIAPINIRPYRHHPSQKDAIETMVKELLDSGVIRASHNPFSSLIVMVKKKDGS